MNPANRSCHFWPPGVTYQNKCAWQHTAPCPHPKVYGGVEEGGDRSHWSCLESKTSLKIDESTPPNPHPTPPVNPCFTTRGGGGRVGGGLVNKVQMPTSQ